MNLLVQQINTTILNMRLIAAKLDTETEEEVEVVVRELVFESELVRKLEGLRELGGEGREVGSSSAVHGRNAGVTTGIAELLGVAPGEYVAIVATHQTELGTGIGR